MGSAPVLTGYGPENLRISLQSCHQTPLKSKDPRLRVAWCLKKRYQLGLADRASLDARLCAEIVAK